MTVAPADILKSINASATLQKLKLTSDEDSMQQMKDSTGDISSTPILSPNVKVGDRIEISPSGIALIQDISNRIGEHGGGRNFRLVFVQSIHDYIYITLVTLAALIIDYGRDHPSEVSLRGIQNHQFVSALQEPGDVDLVRLHKVPLDSFTVITSYFFFLIFLVEYRRGF